jgi:uncharacterized damage-inducible protein DinB
VASLSTVQTTLSDYFRSMVQQKVHELVEPLTTEQLWQKPYNYGNSIGNLILHLTGNLNYYIGTRIAGTAYIRDRALEFIETGKSKDEILESFDNAIRIAVETVEHQSDQDLSLPYTAERADGSTRFGQILACASHAYHHVGQIIYLQKELLKQPPPIAGGNSVEPTTLGDNRNAH